MAIDPRRLDRELDRLAELTGDPQELQRAIQRLLDGYQVRRRSAGRQRTTVPQPVLRALARSLRTRLEGDAEATAQVAAALWKADRQETRNLAAQLLAAQHSELAADLAERWTHGSVAVEQVRELAELGLAGWRASDPESFLRRCAMWLEDRQRLLGLYALHAAVADPEFEHLPEVYRLVEGLGGSLRGRPRRALLELIRALVKRAPVETMQFLRDELNDNRDSAKRLIQDLLPSLPADQRQALRASNGIIRARADHRQRGERET